MADEGWNAIENTETVKAADVLEAFLQKYVPGEPVSLNADEKNALRTLLFQLRDSASDSYGLYVG